MFLCVGDEIQYPAYTSCLSTLRSTPTAPQIVNVTVSQSVNHALIRNIILVPQTDLSSYLFSITTLHCPKSPNLGHKHILPVWNFYKAVTLCTFLLFGFSSALWRDMLESKPESQSVSFTSWVSANVLTCVLVLVDGSCLVFCGSSRYF